MTTAADAERPNLATVTNNDPAPLDSIINLQDFQTAAQKAYPEKIWAYQASAANDCFTRDANAEFYRRIWFRPRVLVGVKNVSTSATILGHQFELPVFSSPAAAGKLSHPDGELALARGLAASGTTIVTCNYASYSFAQISGVLPKGYPLFCQIYVNPDRSVTESYVREVSQNPSLKAILVTVDLPVVGKRDGDQRVKMEALYKAGNHTQQPGPRRGKTVRIEDSYIDSNLTWDDIEWLKSLTDVPIFVKGIQSSADAKKALTYGCGGICISNHGGRALDTAQPSILTLLECQANCPEVLEQMEVWIDGGIRRGTDVLKAICLGASGVLLGRSFLFALRYGQDGVEHAVEIIRDELATAMQMVGITSLDQAHPGLLNTTELDPYIYRGNVHPWARKIVRTPTKERSKSNEFR